MSKEIKSKSKISHILPALNFNAAGIDVGSREHYVAVPEGRDEQTVRSFETFTADLIKLAEWLKECDIDTVVMESTGVYWLPLFDILEERGFEVLLVNAGHVKNVPGRKSDVSDCQWLQQLHTYGLLRGSFHPDAKIRELRTYLRQRDMLVSYCSSHIQHIQKVLTLMNVQLHNVISDITGLSGMRIIRAIIQGEKNPDTLVEYCDRRLKNPVSVIKKSLEGNYNSENLFILKQTVDLFDYYQKQISECEQKIKEIIQSFESKDSSGTDRSEDENRTHKKYKKIDKSIQNELKRITSVDLTQIDGLNTTNLLTLISEVGLDMTKWKTEKHFTSWLGLAPNNKISGGKVLSRKTKKTKNRAGNVFRLAASTLSRSESYLGGAYRRYRSLLGPGKANVAVARKIAVIFYNTLKNGQEYYDYGCEYYEKKTSERSIKYLKLKARHLGFDLVPSLIQVS
jgi:transposase